MVILAFQRVLSANAGGPTLKQRYEQSFPSDFKMPEVWENDDTALIEAITIARQQLNSINEGLPTLVATGHYESTVEKLYQATSKTRKVIKTISIEQMFTDFISTSLEALESTSDDYLDDFMFWSMIRNAGKFCEYYEEFADELMKSSDDLIPLVWG